MGPFSNVPNALFLLASMEVESLERVKPGYLFIYTVLFGKCGLVFPIQTLLLEVILQLKVVSPQMTQNLVSHVMGMLVLSRILGFLGALMMC